MKAADFLEALIGEKGPFERLGGFDVEDFIEAKSLFKNTPVQMYGTEGVAKTAFGNVNPRAPVSDYQVQPAKAYAQAIQGVV